MNEQINRFLEHAADALDDANFLHQHGRVLALANRADGARRFYDLTIDYFKQNPVA